MNFVRQMLLRNARTYAAAPALVLGERTLTHAALNARVNRVANGLLADGRKKGDVVALFLRNSLEFAEIFLASHKIGTTLSPTNVGYKARELGHQLRHCGARTVFFGAALAAIVEEVRSDLAVERWVCVGDPAPDWASPYERFLAADGEPPAVDIGPDDIGTLLYTSGTTGVAKGVPMRFWGGLFLGILETNNDIGLSHADVTLAAGPLYHQAIHGFTLVMPLSVGGTVVMLPAFDPEAALAAIESHRVTFSFFVPTMLVAMLASPEIGRRDLSTLRRILSSGSALPEPTKRALLAGIPGLSIFENYGSTECWNAIRLLPADVLRKEGCAGLPIPTQQVRLVDRSGREVGAGEIGEIITKGPAGFRGYHNPPAGYEDAVDADGWFHTGDLARKDDEGYFYIVGRLKEVIVSGGINIYPKEIEDVILEMPMVRDCAVVGVPDDYWGETIAACVVRSDPALGEAAVVERCRRELADFKRPRRVVFLDALPRNPSGKIVRATLRAMLSDNPKG